ncbi:MAG: NrfD/PsrC family molybdoenzyme membrane anchor subunit [Thermoleophilaceae bacterium]
MSTRERRMVEPARPDSYYGRPVIKEPVWTWEIPVYFFTGGLAGASAGLAFGASVTGNERLARNAWIASFLGIAVSPALLISDLGRPSRFLNMLRVFKVTSPMSVGSWLLTAAGGAITAAAAHDVLGVGPRPAGRAAGAAAAVLGMPVATYTAALLADTAVPVWHEARRELPFIFGGSALASAGAMAAIATSPRDAGPARRLALGGALAEGAASQVMKHRLGDLAAPYESGACGRISRAAMTLTTAGAATTFFGGRRSRRLAAAGGAAILAGSLLERWSVFRAGFQSARDPKYTVGPQRERRDRRSA